MNRKSAIREDEVQAKNGNINMTLISLLLSWQVFFSPGGNAQHGIIRSIDSARKQILVQAYSFTDKPIARALVKAKERGLDVRIILDKGQIKASGSKYQYVAERGVPVKFDKKVKIQHNKVMIIDSVRVITGSYNFTKAAHKGNAENLLIIDDRKLSVQYLDNWHKRNSLSTEEE